MKKVGKIVADQVPVAVCGVELGGEPPRITQGFRRMVAMDHSGETHKHRRALAAGEYLGLWSGH